MVTLGAHESTAASMQGDSATDTAMCADVPQQSVEILAAQAALRKPAGKPVIAPCFLY